MKFTLVALAAGLAAAAPEATPWCMRPGQSCWKVKRAAEAFADAIHTSGGLQARSPEAHMSNLAGGAAFAAKRSLSDLANLIALTEGDPFAFYEGLDLDTKFEEDTDTEKAKRDAEPWCMSILEGGKRVNGCPWKRDAEAIAEDKRWCMRPGQSCWKAKRAAEAVIEAVTADLAKRDAEGDSEEKRWCMRPGQSCWKAKRDAEAEAEGEERRWCMRPGQSCWKREEDKRWCMRPGQSCWKAKRDLQAIHAAARDVVAGLE